MSTGETEKRESGAALVRQQRTRNTIPYVLEIYEQQYAWPQDGDEWDPQCGRPYDEWKQSLLETFILPNVSAGSAFLEMGAGHGRWAKEIVGRCRDLVLVDLSPKCIDFCKQLFAPCPHVRCVVTDGKSLPGVGDQTIDFVWSFDTFYLMDREVTREYLREICRVLKPGGKAIVQHAGRVHAFLWLGGMTYWGLTGRALYTLLSMGRFLKNDGGRSNLSGRLFARLAADEGLDVETQIRRWGPEGEYGLPPYRDCMTVLRRSGA
jgi:SAM-dependent methyltransferase